MRVGLLLPHFGSHATPSRLRASAPTAERLGYDSIWVRDHVVYWPHSFEDPDLTFIEPFSVLSMAAAQSETLLLGTATLIPYRHPIHSAMSISSLARIAGPERLRIAWGLGNDRREFAAVGAPGAHRGARLDEHVAVVRALLAGQVVSHSGAHYHLDDVQLRGTDAPITFWYGGSSTGAMARTAATFDGLLASRVPRVILSERVRLLRELSDEIGRTPPEIGLVVMVSPADTIAEGLAAFDLARLRAEAERRFPDHDWSRDPELGGVLLAGQPEHLVAELLEFERIGVDHVVMDLRVRFGDWETVVEALARQVLPRVTSR
jgi:alkanesulfonate monooxygenase SsuD/methylene tetrahydromethanopterin reductase-like flavin-dependent oxidoreductase (luciferase family)